MFVSKQLGVLGFVLGAALALSCGSGNEPAIEFMLPGEGAATRGSLDIALRVRGIAPERMSLFVDDAWVANLTEASYRWDTRNWPEGERTLVARAFVGEEMFSSKGLKVVLDRTPPQIVSTQPARDEKDVAVDAPISIVFSEPLAASALATTALSLRVEGVEMETLAPSGLSPDGKTLFFPSPSRRYLPPVTFSALLVGSVEDAVGNVLVPASDSGWSWQVPVLLSLGDAMADLVDSQSRPFVEDEIALRYDSEGRPMVAWNLFPGKGVTLRWNGKTWDSLPSGPALTLISEGSVFSSNGIVLDAQGRPTTAWCASVDQGRSLMTYVHFLESGQWKLLGSASSGSVDEFMSIRRVVLRRSSSGLTTVARMAVSPTSARAKVEVLQALGEPGGWETSVRSTHAMPGRNLALEVTTSGFPVVAWSEFSDSVYRIAVDRLGSAGWESLPGLPSSVVTIAVNPSLALEPDGTPWVAWSRDNAIEVHRWANGAWQAVGQPIPAGTGRRTALVVPALALSDSGQPLLAWSIAGRLEVWALKEGTWVQLARLLHPVSDESAPWPVFLRADGPGSPLVAWMRRDSQFRGSLGVYRLNL